MCGGGGGSRLEIKCSVEDRNVTEPKALYWRALGQVKGTVCVWGGGGRLHPEHTGRFLFIRNTDPDLNTL